MIALDTLDRLDRLTSAMQAVTDLMIPERDLHAVGREQQAILMDLLVREAQAIRAELARPHQG